MLKFGREAVDSITGFTGKITGYAKYMTGCNQYSLETMKDGDIKSYWFDEQRVQYVTDKKKKKIVPKATGGPSNCPPSRH